MRREDKCYLGVAERHVERGRKIHTNCRGVHVSARSDKRFDDFRMVLHSSTVERSKAICAIDEYIYLLVMIFNICEVFTHTMNEKLNVVRKKRREEPRHLPRMDKF